MRIVLDTNVLLVSISPRSVQHGIWQNILKGRIDLVVTTDILNEYAEIIGQHMGNTVADAAIDLLTDLPNIYLIQKYYRWELIASDPDDNKFVDAAVARNADYIVTNDKHFQVLEQIPFPALRVISSERLMQNL